MDTGLNECKERTIMGYVPPSVLYIRVCIGPLQFLILLARQEYPCSSFLSILLIRSVVIFVNGVYRSTVID